MFLRKENVDSANETVELALLQEREVDRDANISGKVGKRRKHKVGHGRRLERFLGYCRCLLLSNSFHVP
jgi:hypothetical protein